MSETWTNPPDRGDLFEAANAASNDICKRLDRIIELLDKTQQPNETNDPDHWLQRTNIDEDWIRVELRPDGGVSLAHGDKDDAMGLLLMTMEEANWLKRALQKMEDYPNA